MATSIKTGSYTGNGAAQNISVGFEPDYVRIINVTDGDEAFEWFDGMTSGHAIKSINVVDSGATGAAGMSRITANGVTPYAGSTTAATGFTVGTAISESAKTYNYIAVESGPGAQ